MQCAVGLDSQILYDIWERITKKESNNKESSIASMVASPYLKESQFYLACKLVAIHQNHLKSGLPLEELSEA